MDRNNYTDADKDIDIVVALLAEGVDRNTYDADDYDIECGRPPRGGRG